MGNPWIIKQTTKFLEDNILSQGPSNKEKLEILTRHFNLLLENKGERIGVNEMRKHAVWYTKGMRNSAKYRDDIMKSDDSGQMFKVIAGIISDQE
jgi:tRNA-dihydrouridine synthase